MTRLGLLAAVVVLPATTLVAQPTIDHSGLDCMRPGEFVVVLTGIDPADVETAKVYFRSRLYRDFYYVEMTFQDGQYVGILPQPSEETSQVIYYLEALDSAFNTARSREFEADVEGRCRSEPAAAYLPGGGAGITVGATASGAASIPPGFTAAGIIGTIAATGVVSGVSGGIGAGTAVVIGAAAAAAGGAGLAVLSAGTDGATTSSVIAGLPTTSAATTSSVPPAATTSAGPGPAPSTTTIAGAPTTTVPAGSTTTVPAGSTTTTVGGGSSTTTTTGGSSSTTTTPPTTTQPPTLDASCFNVAALSACRVRVDASCVALPVDQYEWILDLNDRWSKIEFLDGPVSLEHAWSANDCGDGQELRFRLKVRRGGVTSTAHKNVFVAGSNGVRVTAPAPVRIGVTSHLMGAGTLEGRVLVNETLVGRSDNTAPVEHSVRARRGENSLTGIVASASGQPGTWRFELRRLAPGTLRIVSGNVVSLEPNAVVFQLSGSVGERVELAFIPRD